MAAILKIREATQQRPWGQVQLIDLMPSVFRAVENVSLVPRIKFPYHLKC